MKHKHKVLVGLSTWLAACALVWLSGVSVTFRHPKAPQVAVKPPAAQPAPTPTPTPANNSNDIQKPPASTQKPVSVTPPAQPTPQPATASQPAQPQPQRGVSVPIPFTDKQVNLFTNVF